MTQEEIADQQEKALKAIDDMRIAASEFRQLGWNGIAAFYEEQIRNGEKWITKVSKMIMDKLDIKLS